MKKFAFAVAATLAFTAAQAATTTENKPAADATKAVEAKAVETKVVDTKTVATKAVEGAKEATAPAAVQAVTAPAASTDAQPKAAN